MSEGSRVMRSSVWIASPAICSQSEGDAAARALPAFLFAVRGPEGDAQQRLLLQQFCSQSEARPDLRRKVARSVASLPVVAARVSPSTCVPVAMELDSLAAPPEPLFDDASAGASEAGGGGAARKRKADYDAKRKDSAKSRKGMKFCRPHGCFHKVEDFAYN
eukprot:6076428-Alexandrium_andersonii.AAC.1